MEWTSVRAQRAMKLIGVAIVVVVAAAIAYLAPGFARSHSQGTAPQTSPAPFAGQVVDASFGDSDHGAVLMIGEFGTYRTYVTSNGGRTWTQSSQGSILTTFFDPNHAVAIQNGLGFWATADAGRTWAFEALPVNPQGVGFTTTGNIPGALTFQGVGFTTTGNIPGALTFLDPAHGWWFGVEDTPARTVALWQTSDGGRTWKQLAATGIPSGETLSSPVFIDALRAAIVAWPLGLDGWPSILTTQDGGQTWRSVTVAKLTTPGTHLAPTRASGATLIAHGDRIVLSLDLLPAAAVMPSPGVGSGVLEPAVTGWSLASEDGGLTWTSWSAEPATTIAGFGVPVFDDGGRLLLVDDQRLWVSRDAGRTWQANHMQLPPGLHMVAVVSARGRTLFAKAREARSGSVILVPAEFASLGSPAGTLLRSRDGGIHWSVVSLPRA